ncbi:LrgB family protein [Castellaniella ginsengisoli]|uniref:LrgB family protein n=1 Tax=Castellaniella ginsengisoli TaxID=546114 RepID=A0ABN1L0W9_9BURK
MQATLDHVIRQPATWLLATLAVYRLALAIQRRARFTPLLHPVAVSTAILVAALSILGVDYDTYFSGARMIHFLLGPATVALAIPLFHQMKIIRRHWVRFCTGALLGSGVSIALGLSEELGGLASLTSALVMLTGVAGALMTQAVLGRLRLSDPCTHGFTLGVVAHGIGAARAMQISPRDGAFAGLGMGLAGLLTAVCLPLAFRLAGY